jgi:hypothetical protein
LFRFTTEVFLKVIIEFVINYNLILRKKKKIPPIQLWTQLIIKSRNVGQNLEQLLLGMSENVTHGNLIVVFETDDFT